MLKLIGNGAQMMLHCGSSAGKVDFRLQNGYKLGQQGSPLAFLGFALYLGVCPPDEEISVAGTTSQIAWDQEKSW